MSGVKYLETRLLCQFLITLTGSHINELLQSLDWRPWILVKDCRVLHSYFIINHLILSLLTYILKTRERGKNGGGWSDTRLTETLNKKKRYVTSIIVVNWMSKQNFHCTLLYNLQSVFLVVYHHHKVITLYVILRGQQSQYQPKVTDNITKIVFSSHSTYLILDRSFREPPNVLSKCYRSRWVRR